MRAKRFHATDTRQSLAYAMGWHLQSSVSLLSLSRGSGAQAFKMAAIENNGGNVR